ncbi:MAG: DMT family transporter [Rhodospirillaceae bacterium]|jgi:drug/metabolite transporter (DMT)-like permease|nr:DMT family transporter [Rhodospirillaceae bacterium]MBT4590278.1 DMT family transporter [Rhodospirillaceae bacterium]MBT5940702.1 DMT family transporter [Rhodospirillaceae bacterium]MBT7265934.1 DMT family transporter [Rhodospirillaceae bacterium]
MTKSDQQKIGQRAVIVLLFGAAAISLAPIFVRLSEVGPSATAFYRMFFALPVLWVWMSQDKKSDTVHRQPSNFRDYAHLALAGVFFAGDMSFWHWSIKLTSIANSTLLANFAPIFITLGGYFLFGERFSRTFLLGMILAMLGVVFLLGDSFDFQADHLIGDAYGLVAAMFYAAYLMMVSRLRSNFSTATVMTWSGLVTCIAMVPITILSGESFIAPTLFGWAVLAGLALISHAGGQSMIAYALAHLPAAFGSVGLLLQPALAAIIAWFLFDESLSPLQLSGGLVVLAGIYFARRGTR